MTGLVNCRSGCSWDTPIRVEKHGKKRKREKCCPERKFFSHGPASPTSPHGTANQPSIGFQQDFNGLLKKQA